MRKKISTAQLSNLQSLIIKINMCLITSFTAGIFGRNSQTKGQLDESRKLSNRKEIFG